MKKKLLWVLVLLTVLLSAVSTCSAEELTIKADDFYTRFCYFSEYMYGSRFCSGSLEQIGDGYNFKTVGGYTIKLYTKSPDMNLQYAKIYFSLSDTTGDQLWIALMSFYMTADDNLDLTESDFLFLQDYIVNISSNLRKVVYFDNIKMYGGTDKGKFYFTAFGR